MWVLLGLSGDSKRIHKFSPGLIFPHSLSHVGIKTDKNCLSLFSVIFPTPLAFIKLIYLFFPPFPLNLKWLLPHSQHWLTKYMWKVKLFIVQLFAFLLVDVMCSLLFAGAFCVPITWVKINDIFSLLFFHFDFILLFFHFWKKPLCDLNNHVMNASE